MCGTTIVEWGVFCLYNPENITIGPPTFFCLNKLHRVEKEFFMNVKRNGKTFC